VSAAWAKQHLGLHNYTLRPRFTIAVPRVKGLGGGEVVPLPAGVGG